MDDTQFAAYLATGFTLTDLHHGDDGGGGTVTVGDTYQGHMVVAIYKAKPLYASRGRWYYALLDNRYTRLVALKKAW